MPTGAGDGKGRGMGGGLHSGWWGGREQGPGERVGGAFLGVSVGKARQGDRFGTGQFKWPQWALGHGRGCSLAGAWAWEERAEGHRRLQGRGP